MDSYTFENLSLKNGDLIHLSQIGGQMFTGVYDGEYDNSKETFSFSNYSNGKTQVIYLKDVFDIKRD